MLGIQDFWLFIVSGLLLNVTPGPDTAYIVGRSVHDIDSAHKARREGADFAIAGTMYETSSHPELTKLNGPALIEAITKDNTFPVLGIGGIKPDNVAELIHAGACDPKPDHPPHDPTEVRGTR